MGPCSNYKDYIDFIEGRHISKRLRQHSGTCNGQNGYDKTPEPSPLVCSCHVCLVADPLYLMELKEPVFHWFHWLLFLQSSLSFIFVVKETLPVVSGGRHSMLSRLCSSVLFENVITLMLYSLTYPNPLKPETKSTVYNTFLTIGPSCQFSKCCTWRYVFLCVKNIISVCSTDVHVNVYIELGSENMSGHSRPELMPGVNWQP